MKQLNTYPSPARGPTQVVAEGTHKCFCTQGLRVITPEMVSLVGGLPQREQFERLRLAEGIFPFKDPRPRIFWVLSPVTFIWKSAEPFIWSHLAVTEP